MRSLADHAVKDGVDRKRSITECEHFGHILQGIMVGCCADGKELPTLVLCKKIDKPVSAYVCFSCQNFNR
jgi:ribosomal protein L34E